jgi:4-hydroxy-3-methylbut-2-enyl diphosphate reductase
VTDFIRQDSAVSLRGDDSIERLTERFQNAMSPGFDWARDLARVGIANQTTMLMRETEAVAEEFRKAMADRYGESHTTEHVRVLDTICSATQERQDAVEELLADPPDLMIVLGGYNSSNTNNLARICERVVPSYHIDDPSCIESTDAVRHKPLGRDDEIVTRDWLRPGPLQIGLTAGASTPNNKTGETIERVLACRDMAVPIGS